MKKQAVNSTDSDEARSGAVPPRLPSRHEGRLTSYAMAAGAAGVGLLALVPPAKAAIIYTPSHISILYDGTYQGGGFVTYALDINRDGVPDFSFQLRLLPHPLFPENAMTLSAFAHRNNGVLPSPLGSGYAVGPGEGFVPLGRLFDWRGVYTQDCPACPFTSHTSAAFRGTRAFGLSFMFNGATHYNYARIGISGLGNPFEPPQTFLDGYAYETVADKTIFTTLPEPGTLGLLALGSRGGGGRQ